MTRTRSVLVDNTIGSIFRNITTVSQAGPSSTIAGAKLTTKSISGGSASLKIQNNIGGKGIFLIGGGLITQLIFNIKRTPKGSPVLVWVRKGTTYLNSTVIGEYTLLESVTASVSQTQSVNINVAPGETMYFDVTQTGSIYPGAGLSVLIGYYAG